MNIITSDFDGSDGRTMSDILSAAARGTEFPVIVSFPRLNKQPKILLDKINGTFTLVRAPERCVRYSVPVSLFGSLGECLVWYAKHLVKENPIVLTVTDPNVRYDRSFRMERHGSEVSVTRVSGSMK